jgi:hypothetical protein
MLIMAKSSVLWLNMVNYHNNAVLRPNSPKCSV